MNRIHTLPIVLLLITASLLLAQEAPARFKFDFGPGKAAEGYTKVAADTVYTNETGFGFDFSTKPAGVDRGGDNSLRDGFVTGEQPFFFSVKVPEGNYRVT